MPKSEPLTGRFEMKFSNQSRFKAREFSLVWESRFLRYKAITWKRIDFSTVQGWAVVQDDEPPPRRRGRLMPEPTQLISLTLPHPLPDSLLIRIPLTCFHDWLYWILVSMQKHCEVPFTKEQISGMPLRPSRKKKIRSRRDMREFDFFHQIFVEASSFVGEDGATELADRPYVSGRPSPDAGFVGEGRHQFTGIGAQLGAGGGGSVFRVERLVRSPRSPGHEPAAVKFCSASDSEAKKLIREARILSALGSHPNIIHLYDALVAGGRVFLFMERGANSLKGLVESITRRGAILDSLEILTIALGILSGFKHIHKRRIYHLDFKPDNVLIFRGRRPKIIDFGLARTKVLDKGIDFKSYGGAGTMGFRPPEAYGPLMSRLDDLFFFKSVDLEAFDSYTIGITFLQTLLAPKYGWTELLDWKADLVAHGTHMEPQVKEEIDWWLHLCSEADNRYMLEQDGLVALCDIALSMIQEQRQLRIVPREAFKVLKQECRRDWSGRAALGNMRNWE